jgi:hypothetical protein
VIAIATNALLVMYRAISAWRNASGNAENETLRGRSIPMSVSSPMGWIATTMAA